MVLAGTGASYCPLEQQGSEQSAKHGAECSFRTQEESRTAREELNLDLKGGQVAGQMLWCEKEC